LALKHRPIAQAPIKCRMVEKQGAKVCLNSCVRFFISGSGSANECIANV
jgi:hypothetical protein